MSRTLIILPAAEADLTEAKAWYKKQRDGLDAELRECISEALDRIRRLPEAPRIIFEGLRRVLVRRFPYSIFYHVDEIQISVVAIYHTSRDPRGWQERA